MSTGGSALGSLRQVISSRRMVRSFRDESVDDALLTDLVDLARRAPSAGNTQPWSFLVLRGADVDRYWSTTMPDETSRARFRWRGLLDAPVLVIPYVRPDDYVDRYAEADKASTRLGTGIEAWSVPYWWLDGGAAVQQLLLAVTAAGLGGCLFGQFEHEAAVRAAFGVPHDQRALGTIAIGWPAATDEPGRSASRPRRPVDTVVHRGRWES